MTESPPPPAGTTTPSGSSMPTGEPASIITIIRTGGFAGVHDVVELAADGSVHVSQRTGVAGTCTPTQEAIDRLRAIDLGALGPAPSKHPIADGFTYQVVTATASASVGDGDAGPHGELLRAVAEVVTSCLMTVSGSGPSS